MWPRFGIKIGNSTLCIATAKADGKIEVIANKQGDRVSQACLLWDGGNEIECGLTAKQKMSSRPAQAVSNSFHLFVPSEELTEERIAAATKEITCAYNADNHQFELKVINAADEDANAPIKKLSAFEVHVELLKSEFQLARQYLSHSSGVKPSVVLSIPSYYSTAAWPPLAQAAEEAGFHVAQIINEPTAAVLAYGIGDSEETETKYVLTIKCGGLYSHFALYELTCGIYRLLDCKGPFPIGGKQHTEALVQFICQEFHKKYKLDPHESRRSMAKIRTVAANCKHILTTVPSTQIYIDSLMDGVDFNMQMSRARFESLIQPVINNFLQTLGESVEKLCKQHPQVQRITDIVLLGATMQIPKFQSAVSARYPEAKLHNSITADEVVAYGCARQSTFLIDPEGQDLQATEQCVCAEEELLIWHGENEANSKVLLRKGALLPSVVRVDVQSNDEAAAAASGCDNFYIKAGAKVNEISLKDATPTKDGIFQIEAEFSLGYDDTNLDADTATTPIITLRCI